MPLGDGQTWDETNPQQSTEANTIDSYDRDLRVGVRLRMSNEHVWPSSQTNENQSGYHLYMTLQAQTAAPSFTSPQIAVIYAKTDNNLYFNNGSDIQLTQGGSNSATYPTLSISNTGTQVISQNTWTKRTFDTINLDNGSYWSSNKYTSGIAGWFKITYMDTINNQGSGTWVQIAIYKNGSLIVQSANINVPGVGGGGSPSTTIGGVVDAILQLNGTTDYIEFYVYTSSAGTNTAQGSTYSFASISRVA